MRFYLNDASLQGQFDNTELFRAQIDALLSVRRRLPLLAAMRTTPALADRCVVPGRTLRQVVNSWRGSPTAGILMNWVGKTGPFIDEDRLAEAEDLFMCLGIEVTDGGLGEAARRCKAFESAATMSFAGGEPDFAHMPLPVAHGFEDAPIASYDVDNYWTSEALAEAANALQPLPTNWREVVEAARQRFPRLVLPNAIYEDGRLARDPFDAVIRDRAFVLLGILDAYMDGRGPAGVDGPGAREIVNTYFSGDRALFSPESPSNRRDHKADLTFSDPHGGPDIFAHWHGKISHRCYRLHFEWPIPATVTELKIVYLGPKLTKT